jgi:serralysin
VTTFDVTQGQYVRPGTGDHIFNYVGDTGALGGFLVAFVELTAPIAVDLEAGTASSSEMTATGLTYARYISATQSSDTLNGSANDLQYQSFIGNGGNDDIDGRGGFDWVMYDDEEDYGAATSGGGWANGFQGVLVNLANHTARDSYGDTDTLNNIEGVIGTSFADKIIGDSNANRLVGQEGRDILKGGGGKDTLEGGNGSGNSALSGGDGRDTLTGGGDQDVFRFNATADSRPSATKRDFITDFKHNADDIDLSFIDANTIKVGDQAFKFDAAKGSAASAVAKGHIGWYQIDKSGTADDRTILKINVDNDATIEMQIELKGLVSLTSGDFIL